MKRRIHRFEVASEFSPQFADELQQLDRLRELQSMRKALAEVELAAARSLLHKMQEQLQEASDRLRNETAEVQKKRAQALLERQTTAVFMRSIQSWLSNEKKLLNQLQERREEVKQGEKNVDNAEQTMEKKKVTRRLTESRYVKFEEITNILKEDN